MADKNKPLKPLNEEQKKQYSMDTHLIYGKSFTKKWNYSHHVVPPISSSTTFRLDSVERGAEGFQEFANFEILKDEPEPIYIYDRLGEPNKDLLEENLAYAESGEMAVTYSTGMGAISAILGVLCKQGENIVTHTTLYGCTISLLKNWLPRFGISSSPTDLTDLDALKAAIKENTRVVYFESPANPNLYLVDIGAVREIVDDKNKERSDEEKIHIVVDNTFATPFSQRPIELGADFVVHSLTKGIGGFGTDMGGAVIGPKKVQDMLLVFRKDFGAVLAPRQAWSILTYGLTSLPVRMKRMTESAMEVAEFLAAHPKIEFVNYPGLKSYKYYELAKKQMIDFDGNFAPGALLFFGLKGDSNEDKRELGKTLMNHIAQNAYALTLAVSLGHSRTLIEHPASMTHSVIEPDQLDAYGIHPGGIRLSLGLEKPADVILDLEKSLEII